MNNGFGWTTLFLKIFFYVPRKTEKHTGLEERAGQWIMTSLITEDCTHANQMLELPFCLFLETTDANEEHLFLSVYSQKQ